MSKHLIITLDFPPQIGGVATYMESVVRHLQKENEVIVIAQKHDRAAGFDIKSDISIIRKDFQKKWWRFIFEFFLIVRKKRIDFIHVTHVLPIGYIVLIIKFLLRIRYCLYLHGLDIELAILTPWKRFWFGRIVKNADIIITNSQDTRLRLLEIVDAKIVNVIYPAVNPDMVDFPVDQKIIDKYKHGRVIVTVARLIPRKGHLEFLEVFKKLTEKYDNLIYCIIGDGPMKKQIQNKMALLRLQDRVAFYGEVAPILLSTFYRLCEFSVLPVVPKENDREGFGIVYLEAGLFEKVVVGTRHGGVSEAVEHMKSGILVNPGADWADDMYRALCFLLDNPSSARAMGEYGAERVRKNFLFDRQGGKFLSLFD